MTVFIVILLTTIGVIFVIYRLSNRNRQQKKLRILCDNYVNGIEEQPGEQPIRVFYPRFKNAFGNIINELWNSNKIDFSGLKFEFLTENIPCIGPRCTPTKIQVHDSFLSLLWGLCYGILGKAPIRDNVTQDERNNAEQLFDYSLGLLVEYSEWNKWTLPNPELHDKDPKQILDKSNLVFWYAYNFILYHEFAHLVRGHLSTRKAIPNLQKEVEADAFAAKHIVDKIVNGPQEVSGKIGIVTALCSILYSSYDVKGGSLHPDPHHRLTSVLEKYVSDNDRAIWAISVWFIIEWGMKFNAYFKLWPGDFNGNFKGAYYQSLKYLGILQEERNVRVPSMEKEYEIGEEVIHLENSRKVIIEKKFISNSAHFNTYRVQFPSGHLIFVSSDDIAREGSPIELLAKQWKSEMLKRGEKSVSIGLDKDNRFQYFYHTSRHYELKKENPQFQFKWAWGQPSY